MQFKNLHANLVDHINDLHSRQVIEFVNFNEQEFSKKLDMPNAAGAYHVLQDKISINRPVQEIPYFSYIDEITTILHEWGHMDNVIERNYVIENGIKEFRINSRSGLDYYIPLEDQNWYLFMEEVYAWMIGIKLLWQLKLPKFNLLVKLILTYCILWRTPFCLMTSVWYEILIPFVKSKLKKNV